MWCKTEYIYFWEDCWFECVTLGFGKLWYIYIYIFFLVVNFSQYDRYVDIFFFIDCSLLSTIYGFQPLGWTFKHNLGLYEIVIFFHFYFFSSISLRQLNYSNNKINPACINRGFMYGRSWGMYWDLFLSTSVLPVCLFTHSSSRAGHKPHNYSPEGKWPAYI